MASEKAMQLVRHLIDVAIVADFVGDPITDRAENELIEFIEKLENENKELKESIEARKRSPFEQERAAMIGQLVKRVGNYWNKIKDVLRYSELIGQYQVELAEGNTIWCYKGKDGKYYEAL